MRTSKAPSKDELDTLTTMLQQVYVVPHSTHYTLDLTKKPDAIELSSDGKIFKPIYKTINRLSSRYIEIKHKDKSILELTWKFITNHRIETRSERACKEFNDIISFCKLMFDEKKPSAKGTYKLFFINETADDLGIANFEIKQACVFKNGYNNGSVTAFHELLHCFEIAHSFDSDSKLCSKYLFRKYHTER